MVASVEASDLERLGLCCLLSRLYTHRAWPQSSRGRILRGPVGRGEPGFPRSPAKRPLVLKVAFEGTVLN